MVYLFVLTKVEKHNPYQQKSHSNSGAALLLLDVFSIFAADLPYLYCSTRTPYVNAARTKLKFTRWFLSEAPAASSQTAALW